MVGYPFLAPSAQFFEMESVILPEDDRGSDALTPFRIGHSNDGTLRDCRMRAQRFFDLQGGDLWPPVLMMSMLLRPRMR